MFCVGKLANIILYDENMENVVQLFMMKNVDYHFNIFPDHKTQVPEFYRKFYRLPF